MQQTAAHPAGSDGGERDLAAPSGRQIEIAHGDQRATIVEVGGGLRRYSACGCELLDGYAADAICSSARGQCLVPWPNRIRDGSYRFAGADRQVALTEPERHNAIHGLTRWANWTPAEQADDGVAMEYLLHPQPGYPHSLRLTIAYRLAAGGLSVCTTATNVGPTAAPYGAGAHPYLTVGTPLVDQAILQAPAKTRLLNDDRGIPTGSVAVAGTEYDFLRPRAIGALALDAAFTDLERDADGRAHLRLSSPDGKRTTALWLDRHYEYLMLFTGDRRPDVNRRSLGIEPMTCAPNAFQSGDGLVVLESGDTFAVSWGINGQEPAAPTTDQGAADE